MPNPLACMSEWRRVLNEGGRLVLTLHAPGSSDEPMQHNFTPGYLVALMNRLGGFKITTIENVVPGSSWILVAERNRVAEIRGRGPSSTSRLAPCFSKLVIPRRPRCVSRACWPWNQTTRRGCLDLA